MDKLLTFFEKNHLNLNNKKILLATSSGPDSMALLDMMRQILPNDSTLIAAHLDHQLRPDSQQESALLKTYCDKYSLPLIDQKWPNNLHPSHGIEAAARNYRYKFLAKIIKNEQIDYLLTAHHGDDLVENILLKLIRSGNVNEMNSLQPIIPFHGALLVRPLLTFPKQELLDYDQKRHIPFIEDATNDEDETLRNRLRHHVVPLLKQESQFLIKNANRFVKTENLLTDAVATYFATLEQPKLKNEILSGKMSALRGMSTEQISLFFTWQILKNWQRRVYFDSTEFGKQINIQKDGFTLIIYQTKYYLFPTAAVKSRPLPMQDIAQDKTFVFKNRTLLVSRSEAVSGFERIGNFKAAPNANFKAGSIFAGARLITKNGHHVKPKKKFAAAEIPEVLRNNCLVLITADHICFVENIYANQQFNKNDVIYYVFEKLRLG